MGKFIETESRLAIARGWKERSEYGVSSEGVESILQLDSGDGCPT